jgi:O-succinylbenzoate synthase
MKLHAIELRRVRLPLVSPFRTPLGTESVREALLVRVESDDGDGWGECVAGSDPLYCSV